jgi:hypothetical protein
MNDNNSTMSYRERVEAAREPIERGSQKYIELVEKLSKSENAQGWLEFLEKADPHQLGQLYYNECHPAAEFIGAPPAWADLTITDHGRTSTGGLPAAAWGRFVVRSKEAVVEMSRQDVYDPDSGVTTEGPVEFFVALEHVDGFTVSSASELRRIAAALLNAADEADKHLTV